MHQWEAMPGGDVACPGSLEFHFSVNAVPLWWAE